MTENGTSRPYQERLLNGFERSRIRSEVQRSKRGRLDGLKKRYATMLLGASLAVGGIGIPMNSLTNQPSSTNSHQSEGSAFDGLKRDLLAADQIAREVTGGVTAAAETLTTPIARPVAKQLSATEESAKEKFFATEIPFGKIIYREARKNSIEPELVAAVVQQESRFIPTARSNRGAQGLMQLVPKTGRWMGARDLMNPTENVTAGAKYLRYLNDRFDGDSRKVIAAYNAGEGNVRRFNGIPPFRETQNYVQKVLDFKQVYNDRMSGHTAELIEQQLPDSR